MVCELGDRGAARLDRRRRIHRLIGGTDAMDQPTFQALFGAFQQRCSTENSLPDLAVSSGCPDAPIVVLIHGIGGNVQHWADPIGLNPADTWLLDLSSSLWIWDVRSTAHASLRPPMRSVYRIPQTPANARVPEKGRAAVPPPPFRGDETARCRASMSARPSISGHRRGSGRSGWRRRSIRGRSLRHPGRWRHRWDGGDH